MSETCADYLESGRHFRPTGERYASKALGLAIGMYGRMGGKLADTFPPYFRRVGDIIWREGDGVLSDFAGIPGRLVHTPEHTADSLSLNSYEKYDKSRDSIIFCSACSTLCDIGDDRCWRCKCPLLK